MRQFVFPKSDPIPDPENFTWWSKGDLMVWDRDDNAVRRYQVTKGSDYSYVLVEEWTC